MKRIQNLFNTYRGLPKEIYVIFFSRIINCLGSFVHPLLSLILTQKIGMSKAEAGTCITMLMLVGVIPMLIGGKLVDKFGRRKLIIVSQTLGASTLIIAGFIAPTMSLVYIIMLSSIFYSFASSAYDAMLGDITTPENRKASFSLIYMGLNIGFSIGPILGGLLFNKYLPVLFIGDGVTTLISLVLIAKYVTETKGIDKEKIIEAR